jgi:signal transduction histidine kinase/putative methionine-R-sulfoxide reductase with GAF domain
MVMGQILVLGILLLGLAVLVSVPFLDPGWLQFPASQGSNQSVFDFPYIIGLIYLASGFWIFAIRRHRISGLAYVLFSSTAGLTIGMAFDILAAQRYILVWSIALILASGSFISLALLFPEEDPAVERYPWLGWIGYAAALVLIAALAPLLPRSTTGPGWMAVTASGAVFAGLGFVFFVAWLGRRRLRNSSTLEGDQIQPLLLAGVLSFGPIGLWGLSSVAVPGLFAFSPALVLPMLLFPLLSGYVIYRFRLVQMDYIFSRAALYSLMAILIAVGYALIAGGLGLLFSGSLGTPNLLANGLAFFILALGLYPLRQGLQNRIDAIFFRGQHAYQERVQTFSGELTHLVDLPSILQTLRTSIDTSLAPSVLHIYIYDPLSDQYIAAPDSHGRSTSDLRFSKSSSLVTLLEQQRFPLFLGGSSHFPTELQNDQTRLNILSAHLFAPLSGRQRLSGWLALGIRRSGEPYSQRDLSFLDAICDQASLAIERAQVVVNLETRVRETNVLARVAQGVNITLTLDDTLELIYAQTTQVIPTDEFHVMLNSHEYNLLIDVFAVVDDERLSELENRPASDGSPLENDVIRQRRAILTDDYNRECQKRGILSSRTDLTGWMCVPLNAGDETIGTISLGKHDPTVLYTREQLELLQAIGDQVAGSIVKVQLLQETERRARQLSSLNEVTRQLTSTLELEPLLNNILNSGVEILNSEAGSLLLVDENTGELVFRATTGPVAANLLNTRLPPGTGLAGKSVNERKSLIVNDVQNTQAWFKKTDQTTGFVTRSILVVPLLVKGQVTGVVEVINKLDGAPFIQDDLDLLSTFAGQASVAVENARQFTMTDLALAARVDELSAMQRIDRELNSSLDVATTMRITLEWALRQSDGEAGLIGLVEDGGVRIMTSQGYTSELEPYAEDLLPIAGTSLEEVVRSGNALRFTVNGADGSMPGILASAASQVVLPIRRETNTIGLMLIESLPGKPVTDETLGFLSRLSDHAAVAIANAQLIATIQAANVAKSEFVSFVAHELKNPMTSIKGYTELLAAGAVGQVNEAQANFLSTIRSNIERMNTLISDLNDVSKIEAGRLRLDFKALPLSSALEDIVRSTRRQVEEKGQQLNIKLPDELPNVWADRTRLAQVLVNLVSNANKYTPQNGQIEVAAEACHNQWDPGGSPQVVHIWVKDSGIGINPEDQKKIFQKFFRSEDPKTREVPGTGLGLNITKSLVEMQGGKIWFESEYRQGTTFHFTVPIAE